MCIKYFHYNQPVKLEAGGEFPELTVAYHTYGTLNDARDNAIWVCHAYTADSDVADWWPNTVVKGGFLDPEKYFIVCANYLASPYGTTSPISINPKTGKPYYGDYPFVTVRDMVVCHDLLRASLGIERVKMLVGGSTGGFQAMEWALYRPDFAEKLVLIATSYYASPWVVAANESQRMAIESDPSFGEPREDAARLGMITARSIGMLTYRNLQAYNTTQQDDYEKITNHRAASYQRYQGEKLARRFNAYSYHILTHVIDSHNVGRGRGGAAAALAGIKAKTVVIDVDSDILFHVDEHRFIADHIPNASLHTITSTFGHDGFLIETDQLNAILLNND